MMLLFNNNNNNPSAVALFTVALTIAQYVSTSLADISCGRGPFSSIDQEPSIKCYFWRIHYQTIGHNFKPDIGKTITVNKDKLTFCHFQPMNSKRLALGTSQSCKQTIEFKLRFDYHYFLDKQGCTKMPDSEYNDKDCDLIKGKCHCYVHKT
eukprot:Pgem_evm1s4298